MFGLWNRNTKVFHHDPYAHDGAMLAAREQARQTFGAFAETFANRQENGAFDFCVRVPLSKGNVTERMWLQVVSINGSDIEGVLSSHPAFLKQLKIGQRIHAKVEEIEDWTYSFEGYACGGFSVMVILSRDIQSRARLNLEPSRKEALEAKFVQKWVDMLNRQGQQSSERLVLSEDDESMMREVLHIESLLRGNLRRDPTPEELAEKVHLPINAVGAIVLLAYLLERKAA